MLQFQLCTNFSGMCRPFTYFNRSTILHSGSENTIPAVDAAVSTVYSRETPA